MSFPESTNPPTTTNPPIDDRPTTAPEPTNSNDKAQIQGSAPTSNNLSAPTQNSNALRSSSTSSSSEYFSNDPRDFWAHSEYYETDPIAPPARDQWKTCPTCKVRKPWSDFSKHRVVRQDRNPMSRTFGLDILVLRPIAYCKPCNAERTRLRGGRARGNMYKYNVDNQNDTLKPYNGPDEAD